MQFKKWLTAGTIAAFVLTGCGGGGGGDSTSSVEPTATITRDNAPTVTGSAVDSVFNTEGIGGSIPATYSLNSSKIGSLNGLIIESMNKIATNLSKDSGLHTREKGSESCSGGGSFEYDGNENTGGKVTFHECKEGYAVFDGTVNIKLINNGETLSSATASNFKVIVANEYELFLKQASINLGYTNGNYDYPDSIDETITGYLDLKRSYDEDMAVGKYEFNGLHSTFKGLHTGPVEIKADGMVSTPCSGGWVEVKTVKTIVVANLDECPTAGKVEVIGANDTKTTLTAHENYNITLEFNGELIATYSTCEDLHSCPTAE